MTISRVALLSVALIGIIIALDETSAIFTIVSFAWAGFGATFGPLMLFSLFWKRINHTGAVAGMLSGGIAVFIWKLLLKPMGGIFGIYELLYKNRNNIIVFVGDGSLQMNIHELATLEKYNAEYIIDYKNGEFVFSIMM